MQKLQETRVWSLSQENLPEEEMATHSSILAWRIQWTENPGGLQAMGSQRVRCDLVTKQQQKQQTKLFCTMLCVLYNSVFPYPMHLAK